MPCASVSGHIEIYCDTFSSILATINTCSFRVVVFGGNLNYDFTVSGTVGDALRYFMNNLKLIPTYNKYMLTATFKNLHIKNCKSYKK